MNNIYARRYGESIREHSERVSKLASPKKKKKKAAVKKEENTVIIGRSFIFVGAVNIFLSLSALAIVDNYGANTSDFYPIGYVSIFNIALGFILKALK